MMQSAITHVLLITPVSTGVLFLVLVAGILIQMVFPLLLSKRCTSVKRRF